MKETIEQETAENRKWFERGRQSLIEEIESDARKHGDAVFVRNLLDYLYFLKTKR